MPTRTAETIGRREWCGIVDHHLVAGECEGCRAKVVAYDPHQVIHRSEAERLDEQLRAVCEQCIGCGCDDFHACGTPPDTCYWLVFDAGTGVGLCSQCADLMDAWRMGARTPEAAEEYRHVTRHTG